MSTRKTILITIQFVLLVILAIFAVSLSFIGEKIQWLLNQPLKYLLSYSKSVLYHLQRVEHHE